MRVTPNGHHQRVTRAAIYTRISQDRTGTAAGVARQLADCEQLCTQRGWEIVARLDDNDRSAYSGRERPGYLALLDLVAEQRVDVVVAWHADRMWRSVLDQQVFLATGREAGLQLVATPSGEFRPDDADGEFTSTLMAAVARKASQDMSRRIRRKNRERAERGENPGGPRSFGYTIDRKALVEVEARALREAADRLLAGETLTSVAVRWNQAGMIGTRGGLWTPGTVQRTLMSPRVVGRRQHQGQVVGDAVWPPVLEVETWEALLRLFAARARSPRRSPRKHLLSGLAECGKCGAPLGGAVSDSRGARYVCPPPVRGGCSGIVVRAVRAEEWVRDRVVDHVGSVEFARLVARERAALADANSSEGELVARLEGHRWRLEGLDAMLGAGDIGTESYVRTARQVRGLIGEAERELAQVSSAGLVASVPSAGELAAGWEWMGLGERRALLEVLVERLVVGPAVLRKWFNPARLSIVWRA